MTIAAIRAGLNTALAVTGVDRIYTEDIDQLEPPALVIGEPTINYDVDFDHDVMLTFPVYLVVSRGAGADFAVRNIDPYRDWTGRASVPAAVNNASTLSGSCSSAQVRTAEPDVLQWNDVPYLGVRFDVEVLT